MYGHGTKPYLCLDKSCERSALDNGFPRLYNLNDHMKRVHRYEARDLSVDVSSAVPTADVRTKKTVRIEKRQAGSKIGQNSIQSSRRSSTASSSSRQVAIKAESRTFTRRAEQTKVLASRWDQQKQLLQEELQGMKGPQDLPHLEKKLAAFKKNSHRLSRNCGTD